MQVTTGSGEQQSVGWGSGCQSQGFPRCFYEGEIQGEAMQGGMRGLGAFKAPPVRSPVSAAPACSLSAALLGHPDGIHSSPSQRG